MKTDVTIPFFSDPPKPKYPYLARREKNDKIVYFVSPDTYLLVVSRNGEFRLDGELYEVPEHNFTPLPKGSKISITV